MLSWIVVIIAINFLENVLLSAALNASAESNEMKVECTSSLNATGRGGVALCHVKPVTEARGLEEQPSYNMLIQAAYGLTAITILVVAYFIFRTMRLRRKTSFAANAGNRRRKPDNVEMQRLTEEQYDDDETVMYDRTDNNGRT